MRTGVWLVGGRGSVATTAIVGALALRANLVPAIGCVSELPQFGRLPLPEWGDLVFGGHDPSTAPAADRLAALDAAGVLPGLAAADRSPLVAGLASIDREILPPIEASGAGVDAAVAQLNGFQERNQLSRVVVINVSATPPALAPHPAHLSWPALRRALDAGLPVLDSSSAYACAAMLAGCAFVDFTPSSGSQLPALAELALECGVPWAGRDGKTGETLVKSALGPMFARRALRVRNWSGVNLLGGGDGANLADPARAASKIATKGSVLPRALGYPVDGAVRIDCVPDLGVWKTAWDHIIFEGFLGARMTMQFTWQGCDSALAAPLVLDLARLVALAQRAGQSGPLSELAFFFKDPVAADQQSLEQQFARLAAWADGLRVAV